MERKPSLLSLSSRSSSYAPEHRSRGPLLPCMEKHCDKRPVHIRSFFGHCLYRRVLIWTVVSLVLVSVILFRGSDVSVPDVVNFGKAKLYPTQLSRPDAGAAKGNAADGNAAAHDIVEVGAHDDQKPTGTQADAKEPQEGGDGDDDQGIKDQFREQLKTMPWLIFKHLDGYFHGLKALVDVSNHVPEYPNTTGQAPFPEPPLSSRVRRPRPYSPYRDMRGVKPCYLDADNNIAAPSMYAYDGVPQHMPDPIIGSYQLLGMRDDVCFDRFGRYGPYGLGYSKPRGGVGAGMDTESSDSEAVWADGGQINYDKVDWGAAQERCVAANKHRLLQIDEATDELPSSKRGRAGKKGRTAVVVRCYEGFKWTELAILNFRAMVTELSLKSGGEYTVHLLLHVRDANLPIWADELSVQRLLDSQIPQEFHKMATLWSEPQMKLFYPGDFGEPLENPSGADIHGVYRSAHLPLQIFAMQHPEYEHFWNWEMDMRVMGNYYEMLDRIGRWADKQTRTLLWERSARYYIPGYHGTWENFTAEVRSDMVESGEKPIFGPVAFSGRQALRQEQWGSSILPESCSFGQDPAGCGVGEPADLVTLNPIFDVDDSGWVFSNDVTGYSNAGSSQPPRRSAIVTASRLSRRLLAAMHEEVWRYHHNMFSEMFPPSVALHHGLKAVFAPHPIYLDRAWQPLGSSVDAAFNSGKHKSASGTNSPFDIRNEHNHKGTTWYYHSEFAGLLWRRWLGYAQMDGRGKFGGRGGEGTERGGVVEESREGSSGRMCLRSMLLHPIKHEQPSE